MGRARSITALILAQLLAFPPLTFAQTPLAPTPNPAAEALSSQIGVVAAVFGTVEVASGPQAVGRIVQSGAPIHLGDVIKTDGKGRLQILLLDETTFTIGPNSAIVIDEFVYDPSTSAGKVNAHVVEGVFRFVTGKIAHQNPENMKVSLPSGTIGVRGTRVEGRVNSDQTALVVLRGPGPNTLTNRPGSIVVTGDLAGGGDSGGVLVSRVDYGTRVSPGVPPTPAFAVPPT